ncbi:MAG: glycoside hydrolase family 16 protein [Acidiphilium sp.]|nr:glycoside hydrolase family 16 protein [Acidiphilium sp.]MDD4934381.1 glycoside hydrolase family 16 protein [Acidiphilium sp.]
MAAKCGFLFRNIFSRNTGMSWNTGKFAAAGIVLMLDCCRGTAATLNLSGYRMTFDETFSKLDISAYGPGTQWTAHTPWNGDFGDAIFGNPGPDGPFAITPDGLTITARKGANGRWYSGLICSVDRDGPGQQGFVQRYGYFEMKAKLPTGPGTWPAFWLIGQNKSKSASEIDVIEYYGAFDRYYHSTEHVWVKGKNQLLRTYMKEVPKGILSSQFNTFGVLIEPDRTRFYFDRQEYWSTPTPPEYDQPMYILVDLALGGGWPIDHLTSPQVMDIKYVRVYQKIPGDLTQNGARHSRPGQTLQPHSSVP